MAKKRRIQKGAPRRTQAPAAPTEARLREALGGTIDAIRPADALIQLRARGGARVGALLVDAVTAAEDIDVRASAAQALGTIATSKHRNVLTHALKDPEPEVARRAAEAIGQIGGAAELKALRALRPRDPVVKRSVDAAKVLLSYRTGASSGRLVLPKANETLDLGKSKSGSITVAPMESEATAALAGLFKEAVPSLPLADSIHTLDCGRAQYLVAFHKELGRRKNLDRLTKGSFVMGALLRRAQVDGRYHLDGHLLTHPAGGRTVRVFVMRTSGEVSHSGELRLGAERATFSLLSHRTRHTRPIAFEGTVEYGSLGIGLERGQVAAAKSPVQPTPKRPRQLTTAV